MRLDPLVRDYNSFVNELADVLRNSSTRFYLDTSLLLWLTRLGDTARREVLEWCNSRQDSIKVPVWAAHEFHRHAVAGTVKSDLGKALGDTHSVYDNFRRLAAERADDSVCQQNGFSGRLSYMSDLEQTSIRLQKLGKIFAVDDGRIQRNTQEVIEFINDHVLSSDIEPIVEHLSQTGQFRYDHLMPPGFQDKKDNNRFGDVIIWEEIVGDLRAIEGEDAINVVVVSRDKKTDWVTSATLVKTIRGDEKINRDVDLDVPLSHPLLAHEFKLRTGGDKLYIAHPQFLASVLDYSFKASGARSEVSAWVAASHRADHLTVLAVDNRVTTPSPLVAIEASLASATAKSLMVISVSSEIKTLAATAPGEGSVLENAATNVVDQDTAYKFGRLLGELVAAGDGVVAGRTVTLFELLIQSAGENPANAALLSFGATAYFDQYGEPRIVPVKDLATLIFQFEGDSRFALGLTALRDLLANADANLPYLPGSDATVKLQLDLRDGRLRDVRIGEHSALVERPNGDARLLSSLFARENGCTGKELRALIARELLIPVDRLTTQSDNKRMTWAASAGLAELDTTAEGGLSVFDDEERQDG